MARIPVRAGGEHPAPDLPLPQRFPEDFPTVEERSDQARTRGAMGKSSCVMDRFEVRELTAAFGPDAEAVMQEHREFRNKREDQEVPRFRRMASERMFCGRGLLIYNRFSIPSIMG